MYGLNKKIDTLKQLLRNQFSKKFFCNSLYSKLRILETEEFRNQFKE